MDKQREADIDALIRLLTYATEEAKRLGFEETARRVAAARDEVPGHDTALLADEA